MACGYRNGHRFADAHLKPINKTHFVSTPVIGGGSSRIWRPVPMRYTTIVLADISYRDKEIGSSPDGVWLNPSYEQ